MLYAFGIGEAPISISGDPLRPEKLVHSIRSVGAVTTALCRMKRGELVGVRGPFGTHWPVEEVEGQDVVLVTYWTMADFSSRDQQIAPIISLALMSDSGRQYVWSGLLALEGAYWQEGLLLRQESTLTLPTDWPSGPAHLLAEVRRATDGAPTPILDAAARPGHTTAELGVVKIN